MKLLRLLALFFLLLISSTVFTQTKFQRVYGGVFGVTDSTQDGLDVKQTNDGGYILDARITFKKITANAPSEDAYTIKVNSGGTLQWSKRHAGTNYEEGRSITQTTDGGYFYAGETTSWSTGGPLDFDAFITKTDAAGNIQWTGNMGDVWNDAAYASQQTVDGGYMAFGSSSNISTNGYSDFYLLKLGNAGNVQWSHTFGGTYFDYGYDAVQTNDGGYIMTGASFSFGNGFSSYTCKSDVNGNFQWGKAVNGFADEYTYGVTQTSDGGYLATGGTTGFGFGSTDILLTKFSSDGSVSWIKNYGGGMHDCGFTVRQTADGGYAVAGGTNSAGSGGFDLFLMKTNSAGNVLWTKTYGGSADEGFSGGMFFTFSNINADVSMITTADGGFAITSQTNSFGAQHVYLIKTDSDGNSDCNETNAVFMEGVPTLSVIAGGAQTNPVQMAGIPTPVVTTPATKDTNVCCVLPVALVGPDVTICQSASTTLNASGGTSYSWNPSGQTTSSISVSPTINTTYIVTVTNSCGSDKDTVMVVVKPLPSANAGPDITICAGASVTLSGATNGTTYSWNPGGQTTSSISVSPTVTTTYTFSATNSCGTKSDSVKIVIGNSIVANLSGNLTICNGGSTTLSVNGGSTYSWNTGQTTTSAIFSPTTTTTYSVIAFSGTCSDTLPFTVTVGAAPTATIAGNTTICFGQNTTLSAGGGGTYSWNTGATTTSIIVSPTVTSNYSVVVNNGGCTDTAVALITVTPSIIFTVTPSSICAGQSAVISASGGGTYIWSTGATTSSITVSPTTNTSYTVQVSSGVCTGTAVATVNVSTPITASIAGNTTVCSGSSATLTAGGGSGYIWNTGQSSSLIVVSPTGLTSYSVIVTSGACSDTAYSSVAVSPPININSPGSIICNGASATLTTATSGGTAPYSYSWNTGATTTSITVSPTSTINYTVTVTDASGCSNSTNVPVTVLAAPVVGITGNISICSGSSSSLIANGAVSYSWSTGSTTAAVIFSPGTTTAYTVTGTDGNGCTKAISVTVTVSQPPVVSITGNDTICSGSTTLLTSTGGGTYSWNPGGQTTSVISVSPTAGTNYTVAVNSGGCTVTATYSVSVIPSPTANAGSNISTQAGQTTTLTATGGGTYSWNNGMTGQTISVTPTATTQYCVIVTDPNGCKDSSCVTVSVLPTDCATSGEIYLPNAFSPNNDNENDVLQVYYPNIVCILSLKLYIYDRWGAKVYETIDPLFKWDGKFNGAYLNTAVFTYYLEVVYDTPTSAGAPSIKKGNISLVK